MKYSLKSALSTTMIAGGIAVVVGVLVWLGFTSAGAPDPLAFGSRGFAAQVEIGILVFREGLESILVLAAITASMVGSSARYRRPIAFGVLVAIIATVATWGVAVGIMRSLGQNVSALHLQAATGLVAIVVLLIVMNWFFHKIYWTGWISLHTNRKKVLLREASKTRSLGGRIGFGLVALGFTSFYREGFEVVLFLQGYRLKLGGAPVLRGVAIGTAMTIIVAVLAFVAHRRLPYRKMLVVTGVMLGAVLLIMVGEQAQEMQLAGWLPSTNIAALRGVIRPWMEIWLGLAPTAETLVSQAVAALLVVGSYSVVRGQLRRDMSSVPNR